MPKSTRRLWSGWILPVLLFNPAAFAEQTAHQALVIHAQRLFDGYQLRGESSVLIQEGKIAATSDGQGFADMEAQRIELGDATLLPGLIELHAHLNFQHVNANTVLKHGITTLRDVGGPLHQTYGGDGRLRVMTSGPILTAANGYPIPNLGSTDIAIAVDSADQAREQVRQLIKGGAVVIKIALEPGGEVGALWVNGHHHHTDFHHQVAKSWPLMPLATVAAIVDEAHQLGRKVTAHLAEQQGVQLALKAGVDEWTHMPCAPISKSLLKQAVAQQVRIVGTLDTLSKCSGIASNSQLWAALGGELLYGAEIAHPDIPWGIDVQELAYMQQYSGLSVLDVLSIATAKAGTYLNIPLLGTLQNGAAADLIAVKGDVTQSLKPLEYPGLVISGGKVIVNDF